MLSETTIRIQAAHPLMLDFHPNSNDIRGQREWRPPRGAPPQRGLNLLGWLCSYYHEGNSLSRPNDLVQNTYAVYPNVNFMPLWEQHIHYNATPAPYVSTPTDSSCISSQSSELPLALPALPSTSPVPATGLDARTSSPSTSTANMVIPSKEIASAAPIISPGIVCWNGTTHASHNLCHICSSVCQIDNLTPPTKMFV
uniref:Uncharacterized protein n=1 Tax=Romanomermis culicivorax TaxID=13658 RepID=A0A915K4C4_ROMCU